MKKLTLLAAAAGAVLYAGSHHGITAPIVTHGVNAAAPSGPVNGAYLDSDQQQFGNRFAADTGLNSGVITAWLLSEESGSAAAGRQAAGNNDWLNIGYTDSGTYGSGDGIWGSPTSAADATAGWIEGHDTIPGYGTASSGIRAIAGAAREGAAAQIAAIQGSGWASSGYPGMDSLYRQVA